MVIRLLFNCMTIELLLNDYCITIETMFCDEATIQVTAGKGGDGLSSFLHEKFRAKGGSDGGNGGDGGSVYLISSNSTNTLYDYKTKRRMKAENGEQGKRYKKHGAQGKDLEVRVPIGTQVFDEASGHKLFDFTKNGQKFLAAKGGEGGFGNAHFVSSVRQAPQVAELGEKGEEKTLKLELKLIADVGLIGLPNVGKSTFLSVVSAARPKIADYPFTTIILNLGVVDGSKHGIKGFSFVIADIPGLIEGASKGKGLGDEFLRHVERNRVLVHFIDSNSEDFAKDFKDINRELLEFSKDLVLKPQIVVITKTDAANDFQEKLQRLQNELKKEKKVKIINKKPLLISAATHAGVKELVSLVAQTLQKQLLSSLSSPRRRGTTTKAGEKVFTARDIVGSTFHIEEIGGKFIITGAKIERFARKTDFSNYHSKARMLDIMSKMGIMKELEKRGAGVGSEIEVSGKKFKL